MELFRIPQHISTINIDKKPIPSTLSTSNILKGRSYNKEYFDRFRRRMLSGSFGVSN